MSGLSKLGKALALVFVVSLIALLSELLYVLCRRRLFLRQDHPELTAKDDLRYFFCLKTHSRVEPAGAARVRGSDGSSVDDRMEVIDLFKLREMYGPSRVLFTIKEEEEREDFDSEKSLSSATNRARTRNLSDSFEDTGVSPELVLTIDVAEDDIEATPFSTPCASPLYFTPTASPVHEILGGGVYADKTAS